MTFIWPYSMSQHSFDHNHSNLMQLSHNELHQKATVTSIINNLTYSLWSWPLGWWWKMGSDQAEWEVTRRNVRWEEGCCGNRLEGSAWSLSCHPDSVKWFPSSQQYYSCPLSEISNQLTSVSFIACLMVSSAWCVWHRALHLWHTINYLLTTSAKTLA